MSKGVSDDQVEGVLLNSQTRAVTVSFALLAVMGLFIAVSDLHDFARIIEGCRCLRGGDGARGADGKVFDQVEPARCRRARARPDAAAGLFADRRVRASRGRRVGGSTARWSVGASDALSA